MDFYKVLINEKKGIPADPVEEEKRKVMKQFLQT